MYQGLDLDHFVLLHNALGLGWVINYIFGYFEMYLHF